MGFFNYKGIYYSNKSNIRKLILHIAQFNLYNSYIPQQFRQIIRDYYAITSDSTNFKSGSTTKGDNDFLANTKEGSRYDLKFNYLINDDFQLAIQNEFGRITNLIGMGELGSLPGLIRTGANVQKKGQTDLNKNVQNLNNLFNYAVWQKTNPLTVNLNIVLYAKTDPLIDVVIPAYTLMSHCIIDFVKEDSKNPQANFLYGFPGLTAFETTKIAAVYDNIRVDENKYNANNNNSTEINSKLMSLYIDGVVNLNLAMIKNITPTFSKHTAKSSYVSKSNTISNTTKTNEFNGDYPIYAELNLQVESIVPADSNMLWEGALIYEKNKSLSNMSAMNTLKGLKTDTTRTA